MRVLRPARGVTVLLTRAMQSGRPALAAKSSGETDPAEDPKTGGEGFLGVSDAVLSIPLGPGSHSIL